VRSVIGRQPGLTAVEDFLAGGIPSVALLLTGGPGIGKTTLWERGLRLAAERGFRVLTARPSGAEAELSFAGLRHGDARRPPLLGTVAAQGAATDDAGAE
jgi:hypothetical protein